VNWLVGAYENTIGSLLGHTQAQTTERYAHLAADPLKAAVDQLANSIAFPRAIDGGPVLARCA
jgi:site-specific recombinase XerD